MPRTRSSRVLWLLEEIGTPYELTEIQGAQRRSVEHLARHPLGRVPALELGDGTTMFESAAICLQLADLNLDAGLIPSVGSPERALVYIAGGAAESPERDRFTQAAGALQSALGERPWLLGDTFTVGDVMCASVLEGAHSRNLLDDWPELQAYVERSRARPAYARAAGISDRPRS
jgi:glutathione S-transferase